MKNILAENLLRFGLKNADASVVNKLQSLSEQEEVRDDMPSADVINKANRIDPVLAKLLVNTSDLSGQTPIVLGDKYVIEVKPVRPGESGTAGENSYQFARYTLYKISVAGGLPWIFPAASLTSRGQGTNDNDFYIEYNQKFSDIDGNGNVAKLNNNWNSELFTPEVIKKAFEYIQKNQAAYKKAYHKFTRSEYGIENYWKPNSASWGGSQYKISILDKLKGNAVKAIDLVQDTGLIQYIIYKVKNFKNDGKYPALDGKLPVVVS